MTIFDNETLDQLRGAYRYEKDIPTLAQDFDLSLSSTYRYAKWGFQRRANVRARRAIPAAVTARRALIKDIVSKKRTMSNGRTFRQFGSAAQISLEIRGSTRTTSPVPLPLIRL